MGEYDPLQDARRKEAEKAAKKTEKEKADKLRGSGSGRDQDTQQKELSLTFVRLEQTQAKEQYDLAAQKYAASNSAKDKKAFEEAKLRYNKANAALQRAGVEVDPATGKQKESNISYYPDRPSNSAKRGFDPYTNVGAVGADNPTERAKSSATGLAPNVVSINPLDNNRWKNQLESIPGSLDYYQKGQEAVPVSFFANSVGAIYYSNSTGLLETKNQAIDRILNEYANAGKMNELRDLIVKVAIDPAEQIKINKARQLPNANYDKDPTTRFLVERAVQLGTYLNDTALRAGQKPVSFKDFLNSYSGQLNYLSVNGNNNGGGAPSRTVSYSKQKFTPEDLELNIDAFFQEYTGQGATQEDVEYLTKRFNAQPAEKTVTTTKGNTRTSVTSGGISQQEQQLMMREMALSDPNAENYNKATRYLDYFEKALAAPIELG